MADHQVAVRVISWEEAERHINMVPMTDSTLTVGYFARMVEEKKAAAFGLFYCDLHVGSFIAEIIESPGGDELHVLAAAGRDPKHEATQHSLAAYQILAEMYGCAVIRFETCRLGIVKKAAAAGYALTEYVMKKEVRHGQ